MKPWYLIFGLLLVSGASAQTVSLPQNAPVTVVESNWRQEVFVPALYDDPMQVNQDTNDLLRDQRATARENVIRTRQGETAIPIPTKKVASNTPVGSTPMGVPIGDEPVGNKNAPTKEESERPSSTHYVYEARIKNNSEKIIKSIVWEYSLFDGDAATSVGTHRFSTLVSIRPGKVAKVVGRSKTPPARVISAKSSADLKGQYQERVRISAISYADGSVWQTP